MKEAKSEGSMVEIIYDGSSKYKQAKSEFWPLPPEGIACKFLKFNTN